MAKRNGKPQSLYMHTIANLLISVLKWLLIAVMLLYCVTLMIPLVWMIMTSFKDGFLEYMENPLGFPKSFNFKNYVSVFNKLKMEVITKNGAKISYGILPMTGFSLLWSTSIAGINVFFTTLMAYVIAKYRFFGRRFLYALGIFVMITPIVGSMPSAMIVKKTLNVYNNMLLTILTSPSTSFSGLYFLLMHAAFSGISWSYAEAALIDGAGHYTVLFRIMLPMVLPSMAVIFVLLFLGSWNDYMTFLIWLPSYPNLALGMYSFNTDAQLYLATVPEIMAGFTIVIIPTITLYAALQKTIMSKFTVGGLKG